MEATISIKYYILFKGTEGENDLKIENDNSWMKRIIGDLNLPKDERAT